MSVSGREVRQIAMDDGPPTELHYVYMARCTNGALYTGYSKNVERRIAAHNAGRGGRYTRANRPIELLAFWSFQTKTEALQVEYAIKQLPRPKKLLLLNDPPILLLPVSSRPAIEEP
ncbi:GIY-YIG nuclease family protein [Altericista sp. CCNU0014]|uniref:GIY-YIG nuclease family protein n=1 Tax=Altericista sp. CCNU0014 TaxID=3082949 RepID=UPI00384BD6B4